MSDNLNFSSNALVVLKKRYLAKNEKGTIIETPRQLVERVTEAIANVERKYGSEKASVDKFKTEVFNSIADLEFLPNSPTLMNAGKELGQLSACFVVPVEDSMESIFDAIKTTALIHKTGGGTGFSFSRLRSKASIVKSTGGVASGPVSFMKVFDAATQAVKQGGTRRGANMGILRVDHPDILEFIQCKEKEGDIANFNISIAITNLFMEKVIKNEEYPLIDPHNGVEVSKISAREVFDKIAQFAHKNGEPGIIFIDRINEHNPTPQLGDIESTNPCVDQDTLVSTERGLMRIKDIAQTYPQGGLKIFTDEVVLSGSDEGVLAVATRRKCDLNSIVRAFKSGVKPAYKITTVSGYELIATADHKIYTQDGWVKAGELKIGRHKLYLQPESGYFSQDDALPFVPQNKYIGQNGKTYRLNLPSRWNKFLGEMIGLIVGDGWLIDSGKDCSLGITFSGEEKDLLDYCKQGLNSYYGKAIQEIKRENGAFYLSYQSKYFVDFFVKLGVTAKQTVDKRVPESIFTAPEGAVVGFLRGLFSAAGTLTNVPKHSCRYASLSSESLGLLKDTQALLLNLGIKSQIFERSRVPQQGFRHVKENEQERYYLLDGEFYELNISCRSLKLFLEKVGFINTQYHSLATELKSLNYYADHYEEEIKSIDYVGEREVYDLTEPCTHSFIANGMVISNCGEQPLLPFESCNLGSLNLARMLKDKAEGFCIDWDKLERTTKLAVRFLDNVIDANRFPLPLIKDNTLRTRKIGLGVMGWATMLGFLDIAYDSDEAVNLAKKLMDFIYRHSKDESMRLARERGVFPTWRKSVWDKRGIQIRNATLTTIAPTGTISIIAGPTSSGIEPNFSLGYFRNVLEGEKLLELDPAFEWAAKKHGFYSPELMKRIASGESIQKMQEVPEHVKKVFKTAMDITPYWHIKMQAAFQEFTDNAVSKTINLPHSASLEDIKESYLLSYKLNCKGVTVYRDGSRDVQVLTTEVSGKKKESVKKDLSALGVVTVVAPAKPKARPDVISGTTAKLTTGCGNLYITVNQDEDGGLFEVFMQMGKAGGCAASQLEAVGRLVSTALRGGIDIKVIIEQLKGIRCPSPSWANGQKIFSCADAIARALEQRIVEQKNVPVVPQSAAGQVAKPAVKILSAKPEVTPMRISQELATVVGVCSECGNALRHQEGCLVCDACGFSKC